MQLHFSQKRVSSEVLQALKDTINIAKSKNLRKDELVVGERLPPALTRACPAPAARARIPPTHHPVSASQPTRWSGAPSR